MPETNRSIREDIVISSVVSDIVEQWSSGLDSSGTIVTKRVVKAVLKGTG